MALYWAELTVHMLMQRTNQSYAKSSQTAKHEKKIEIKYKREQLVQVFKQKSSILIVLPVRPKFRNTLILLMLTDGQITLLFVATDA